MSVIGRKVVPAVTKYVFTTDRCGAVRFVFVSDLHGCRNQPVIDAIEPLEPDAVLVGGDFIHGGETQSIGLEFLRLAASRAPVFCCIGNHERSCEGDLAALIAPTGATLLDNASTDFRGVTLGGLSSGFGQSGEQGHFMRTPAPDLSWLDAFSASDGYRLLLCHHPEYYGKYLKRYPIDLILSGHAHGGQWRFFGRGVFAPGQGVFPKYTSGLYDGRLIVGRGVGNPHIIPRINNRPEIILIEIKRKRERS